MYDFLLVFNINVIYAITLLFSEIYGSNMDNLEFDHSRSLKVIRNGAIEVSIHVYDFLLVFICIINHMPV